jgi:predicted unusual protein kinase regulating ubiquinone biosynthesis (AarF/ABC1/UbiB family)
MGRPEGWMFGAEMSFGNQKNVSREVVPDNLPIRERVLRTGDVATEVQEFLDQTPEKIKKIARQEAVLHDRLYPALPENHDTTEQLKELMNYLLQQVNLPPNFLRIKIFDSASPDLHVQIREKTIRISRSFLEVLEGNAEEIAAALAHEIGHVLLAHYQAAPTSTPDGDLASYDPLNEHIQRYEHENQADRVSGIICNRLGIPPTRLDQALSKLENHLTKKNKQAREAHKNGTSKGEQPTEEYYAWVLGTHPHTTRRSLSIKHDAAALPHYPKKFKWTNIPVPEKKDFKAVDLNKWTRGWVVGDKLTYPDCVWEKIKPPGDLLTEEKFAKGVIEKDGDSEGAKYVVGKPKLYFADKGKSGSQGGDPISSIPEVVNAWKKEDEDMAEEWWAEAIGQFDAYESYQDLEDDVRQYSLSATELLLQNVCPEYCVGNTIGTNDEDYQKNFKIRLTLDGEPLDYGAPPEVMLTSSLLIRNWFKKDKSLEAVEGMERMGKFLRNFYEKHGDFLPYSNARFFIHIEKMFNQAGGDEVQKKRWAAFCEEYETELGFGGKPIVTRLAEHLMPNAWKWINRGEKKIFTQHLEERGYEKEAVSELPGEIYKVAGDPTLSSDVAREYLKKIPYNFRPRNVTQQVFGIAESINKSIDQTGNPDALLESSPVSSANYLSPQEFDEKYFGKGRLEHKKAAYLDLDKHIGEFNVAAKLWRKADYPAEFERLDNGVEKVKFVLEALRVRSAYRDALLAKALEWHDLKHVEDVAEIQKAISDVSEIKTLQILSDAFSNALLNIAVSQRMWELCKKDPEQFLSEISGEEKERARKMIMEVPGAVFSEKLLAILICFPSPGYLRDELLRPLVDQADSREATLAAASWYIETPPGIIKPRSGDVVAVSETFMDILRGMDLVDKQELFLYFLGHRTFVSGIDIKFFPELEKQIASRRKEAIFGKAGMLRKKYEVDQEEMYVPDFSSADAGYIVDSPDSLVILTKVSGVPVDILLREQRLITTKREQQDFMNYLLFGENGLLGAKDKEKFLKSVARNIVEHSEWGKKQDLKSRQSTIELLAYALQQCPEHSVSDLFLGMWNLQQDKQDLPQVVASLLKEMGSLFVKAGQYLGTQSNSLPLEWVQAFRSLSDQNTRAEKTLVYEHERAVYGEESPLNQLGAKLGEGSMAAVYKGEIAGSEGNKEKVAVKIFHTGTKDHLDLDAQFLGELVQFINQKKDQFGVRLPENLAEVSRAQILKELSYENVQQNYTDMSDVLGRSPDRSLWKVAEAKKAESRPGFVVYRFSEGTALDSLASEHRVDVEDRIAMELLRQIMVEGVYQADPNIGNFKVVADQNGKPKQVDWLDLDHVGRLEQADRSNVQALILELFTSSQSGRSERLAGSLMNCVQLGEGDSGFLKSEIADWVEKEMPAEGASFKNIEETFTSFLDFLGEKKLLLKEEYVTLLRTLGLMKPFLQHLSVEKAVSVMSAI